MRSSSNLIGTDQINDTTPQKGDKHRIVDKVAEFPGGIEEMSKFIAQNIKYPDEARKKGLGGVVLVEFTITKEGDVTDIKTVVGIDPILDEEAIRVIRIMPKWTPAELNKEKVNMIYQIPSRFKLDKKD